MDLLFFQEDDTISGELLYFNFKKIENTVVFTHNGKENTYSFDQLRGLKLRDGRYYSTQIIEGALVEVLMEGTIDLYRDSEFYYLKKGETSMLKLYEVEEKVLEGGVEKMRTRQYWKGVVIQSIYDCIPDAAVLVRAHTLSEKSLLTILTVYHECLGTSYQEYGLQLPWFSLNTGFTFGAVQNRLSTNVLSESFNFMVDHYDRINTQLGLFFHWSAPRVSQNWGVHTEVLYAYQYYYSDYEATDLLFGSEYREYYLNINTLSVPVAIQYNNESGKLGYYLNFGTQVDFYLNTEGRAIWEKVIDQEVETRIQSNNIDFESIYYGYLINAGIRKEINGLRLGFGLRYTGWPRLSSEPTLELRGSRFSLNAKIYLK